MKCVFLHGTLSNLEFSVRFCSVFPMLRLRFYNFTDRSHFLSDFSFLHRYCEVLRRAAAHDGLKLLASDEKVLSVLISTIYGGTEMINRVRNCSAPARWLRQNHGSSESNDWHYRHHYPGPSTLPGTNTADSRYMYHPCLLAPCRPQSVAIEKNWGWGVTWQAVGSFKINLWNVSLGQNVKKKSCEQYLLVSNQDYKDLIGPPPVLCCAGAVWLGDRRKVWQETSLLQFGKLVRPCRGQFLILWFLYIASVHDRLDPVCR